MQQRHVFQQMSTLQAIAVFLLFQFFFGCHSLCLQIYTQIRMSLKTEQSLDIKLKTRARDNSWSISSCNYFSVTVHALLILCQLPQETVCLGHCGAVKGFNLNRHWVLLIVPSFLQSAHYNFTIWFVTIILAVL